MKSALAQTNLVATFPYGSRSNDNPFLSILQDSIADNDFKCVPAFSIFGRPKLCAMHLHWPESIFWNKPSRLTTKAANFISSRLVNTADYLRGQDRPVVWTIHNESPHEFLEKNRNEVLRRFEQNFLPMVTDVICMSEQSKFIADLHPLLGSGVRRHVLPHPNYESHFQQIREIRPPEFRNQKQQNHKTIEIAHLGYIRPYKGIEEIITAIDGLNLAVRLTIAGSGDATSIAECIKSARNPERFRLINRSISDSEYKWLTINSNFQIFNFKRILNSGSLIAALSLRRPIIAPELPIISTLRREISSGWLYSFKPGVNSEKLHAILSTLTQPEPLSLDFCSTKRIGEYHTQIYSGTRT